MKTEQSPQAKHLSDYKKPSYLVDTLELTIELDDCKTRITSKAAYYRNGSHDDSLILDGENQTLLNVFIDGEELGASHYQCNDKVLTIGKLPSRFELTVISEIDPLNNTSLEGLYKSAGVFCTQCEAEGFRKITYYPDRPDVLAKFTTHIIGDKSVYPCMLSNGNKVKEEDLGSNLTKVTWQDPFPKPAYLFALVAGDLDVLKDHYTTQSGRKVALALFVDKGNLGRADFAIESLKKSMKWDEERFDLEYDLDIYMIVAVDFFNMGAMENKGLNVFNSKCVLADQKSATDADYLMIESIVGHEYFHNWTGNRVTCRDWFQLSLKEGLTVFRDQEFSMDLGSRAVNRIQQVKVMRSHQFAEDAGPMSHPIRPESVIEMNNFYTVTVYDKGAEVIRMLHSILGESGFQKGMRLYFERHDGQAVTCDDFVLAMQDANEHDLSLFKRWYSQSGTPKVTVEQQYDANTGALSITLEQTHKVTADQSEKQPLHIPVNIAFYDNDGKPLVKAGGHEKVLNLTQEKQSFVFDDMPSHVKISYLREFSAPVQLEYTYADDVLASLIKNETSDYSCWELLQTLYLQEIKAKVADSCHQFSIHITECLSALLADETRDQELLAELLKVPNASTVLAEYEQADIDDIIAAIDSLNVFIATSLDEVLKSLIKGLQVEHYQFNQQAMAERALKNASLLLLSTLDSSEDLLESIQQQYQHSDNMTDSLAALGSASKACPQTFENLMKDFEEKWTGDPLVMDKWLGLSAAHEADNCIDQVKALMSHRDFSMQNPNRVRALIGAFVMNNTKGFHHASGKGYVFLTDCLIELNKINPQVASRLMTPLIQFQKLDDERQSLIKVQLNRLAQEEGLSSDLFEKVTKALN